LATAKTSSFLAQEPSEPCPPSNVFTSEPNTDIHHSALVEFNFKQAQNSSIWPCLISLSHTKLHPPNHGCKPVPVPVIISLHQK
ncbi:hypothetical protein ILYODFUR_037280, partial [Ilyodon furcidens]